MIIKARSLGVLVMAATAGLLVFSQTQESTQLFEKSKDSVLSLYVYGGNKDLIGKGAGFGLAEDIVATSYHLVSQAEEVEGINFKGKKMKVEGIISFDRKIDVALLKVKGKVGFLTVGDSEGLQTGARLFALGVNESGEITIGEGTLRNVHKLDDSLSIIESSISVPEGYNGGPLLDLAGNAVGLVVVLERSRVGIPVNLWKSLPRTGKATAFRDWTKEDYFASVEGAYMAGRVSGLMDETLNAQKYLERVIKAKPDMTEAQALLASVYAKQRNYAAAVTAYQRVIELDPNRASAHLRLGDVYFRMQRWNEAAEALERGLAIESGNKEALFQLGSAYEEARDFVKASGAYERFLKLNPENAWSGYLRLGSCRMELQQYDQAVVAFEEAQKAQPRDIKINYNLAQAYRKAGQYDQAEATFRGLAELDPNAASSYYSEIIKMYDETGQNEKAIAAARKVIELNPKSEMAVYNLAIMFQKLKRYEEAIAAFREALAIKPDYDVAYYNIGSCYLNLKKYKESIEAFKNYVALVPDNADAWLQIGVCYMQLKDFDSALDPLKKCVDLRPDYGVALFNLAVVYLNLNDNYSARDVYKTLVNVDPELAERLKKYLR